MRTEVEGDEDYKECLNNCAIVLTFFLLFSLVSDAVCIIERNLGFFCVRQMSCPPGGKTITKHFFSLQVMKITRQVGIRICRTSLVEEVAVNGVVTEEVSAEEVATEGVLAEVVVEEVVVAEVVGQRVGITIVIQVMEVRVKKCQEQIQNP